jgi:hypothetical protein
MQNDLKLQYFMDINTAEFLLKKSADIRLFAEKISKNSAVQIFA